MTEQTDVFSIIYVLIVKIQSADSVTLSVEFAGIRCSIRRNGRPDSPALCLCAVIACNITLVYCDVCGENGVCGYVRICCIIIIICVYICRKPVQLTGVGNLIHAVDLFRFLVVGRIVFAETVVVPVVIGLGNIRAVGVVQRRTIAVCVSIDRLAGAVQNRVVVLADGLVERNGFIRFAAVQQVADFAVFELLGSFCSCAVDIIGFAVGEVVAIANGSTVSTANTAVTYAVAIFYFIRTGATDTADFGIVIITRYCTNAIAISNRTI